MTPDIKALCARVESKVAALVAERDALQARVRELEAANCGIVEVLGFLRAENEGLRKDAEHCRLHHWEAVPLDIDAAMAEGQYAMTDSIDSPQAPLK